MGDLSTLHAMQQGPEFRPTPQEIETIRAICAQLVSCNFDTAECPASCLSGKRLACIDAAEEALVGMLGVIDTHAAREDPALRSSDCGFARLHIEEHASIAEQLCALTHSFSRSPSLTLNALSEIATGFLTRHPAVRSDADLLHRDE